MERREAMDINIVLRAYGLPSTEIEVLSAHEKSQMMNAFKASEHDKELRSNPANSRADRNHNSVVQKDCVVVIEQLPGEVGKDRAKLENGNPRKRTFSDLDDGFELKASKNTRLSLKKNERSDFVVEHHERTSPDKKMLSNKKDELPIPCRQSSDSQEQRNNSHLDHSSMIEGKSIACVAESSGPLVRKYRIKAIDPRPLITPDGCDWREHSKVVLQYFNNWARRYHNEQSRILTRVAWGKPIDVKIARPRQKPLVAAHTAGESSAIATESLDNDTDKIEVDQSASEEIDEKVSKSDGRPCTRRQQTISNRALDDDQGWLSKKDFRGNALTKRAATREMSDEESDTTDEIGDSDSDEDFVVDQTKSKRKMTKIPKKSDGQQSEKTKKTFRRFFKPVDKKEDPGDGDEHGDGQVTSSKSPVNFIDLEPVTDLQRYLTGNNPLLEDTQNYSPESFDAIDSGFSRNEVNRPETSNPVSGTVAKDDDSDTVEIQSDDEGQSLPPLKLIRPSIHQFKFQPRVQTPEPPTSQHHQNIQQCPMCLKDVPADDYMTHVPRCVDQCGS